MRAFIIFSLIFTTIFFNPATVYPKDKDIERIRERVISNLLEPDVNEAGIKKLISTVGEDGSWLDINYEDVSRTGFQHGQHLNNLLQISRAYKKNASGHKADKDLKKTIYAALDFWLRHDFICENWWWNEIGTPDKLTAVLLLMDKELTPQQIEKASAITGRAHLDASGARPSGDRIKIAGILAKNALFRRDVSLFEKAITVIEGEIKFADGRGMQYDYSFHHRTDRVNNTLSYGLDYADAFAEWAAYVVHTRYVFSEKSLHQLIDYYLDGICKMMVYGKYPDPGATNRDITRPKSGAPFSIKTPERLLSATNYRKDELEEIIHIRRGKTTPTLSHSTFFWQSEHYTHQRPGYFTSVRMFSTRNRNMEEPYNGEGLMNHHRGDGTNYISLSGTEYLNMSPVYDWQKIPGTTILQKPELPAEKEIQKAGQMDFAGAVTDGQYGAVAFDFVSPHDPLKARKAWFFFDNAYVCLGTGIQAGSNYSVATTINQCHLKGNVTVSSGAEQQTLTQRTHQLNNTNWVYHDGIGYLFPQPVKVNLSNVPASGSWFRVNRQSGSSQKEVNMEVFKLWIDHGICKETTTYQYIVMPGARIDEIEAASSDPKIEILFNTPDIQAVRHKQLNITQVICYKNAVIPLPGNLQLIMHNPGIIMLKHEGAQIKEISVADPSRKSGKIHFSLNRKITQKGADFDMLWNETKGISEISIELPQTVYAGKSVTIAVGNDINI